MLSLHQSNHALYSYQTDTINCDSDMSKLAKLIKLAIYSDYPINMKMTKKLVLITSVFSLN